MLVLYGEVRIEHVVPSVGKCDRDGLKKLLRVIEGLEPEGGDALPRFAPRHPPGFGLVRPFQVALDVPRRFDHRLKWHHSGKGHHPDPKRTSTATEKSEPAIYVCS